MEGAGLTLVLETHFASLLLVSLLLTEALTACCAVVTDDRQEIVGGDLGDTLLGQERSQIQPFQGEGDVAVDLEGIHHLVPEPLQVDAKNLKDQRQRKPKYSFATGILIKQHISQKFFAC